LNRSDRLKIMATAGAAVSANFAALVGLTPLYPEIARDLRLGPDAFGTFFVVQGLINVSLQLPIGVLADRIGRRPVLLLGMIFMFIAQVCVLLADNSLVFALSRVFTGLCGPFIAAASFAVVADAYQGSGRAQALGGVAAAATLGQAAGVVVAGLVGPLFGWRAFALIMACFPVALIWPTLAMPEPSRPPVLRSLMRNMLAALRFLARGPALALGAAAALNLGAGVGASFLIPFVARREGLDARVASILLIAYLFGSVIGGPLTGRIADEVGGRIPALATSTLSLLSTAVLGFSGLSLVVAIPCLILVGANVAAIAALAAASITELGNRLGEGTGAALGAIRVGQGLAPGLFPTIAGISLVHLGAPRAFLTLTAGLGVGLLLSAVAVRWSSPSGPAGAAGRP
jgi:predicted MFS family arabinose efflux permease